MSLQHLLRSGKDLATSRTDEELCSKLHGLQDMALAPDDVGAYRSAAASVRSENQGKRLIKASRSEERGDEVHLYRH